MGIFGAVQFASIAVIILSRFVLPGWDTMFPRWWQAAVFVWHLLLVPPWLIWQIARGLSHGAKLLARMPRREEPREAGLSRRAFFRTTAAFTPPLLSLGGAAMAETQLDDFRVRRLEVPITDLPPALERMTIAHVSDTHVGRFTRGKVLERMVEETNKLDADIVALTGDLINDSLRDMPAALAMAKALRGRHLVASCEGNHDLLENPGVFYRECERAGLPLLRNEAVSATIRGQKVQIFGAPWQRKAEDSKVDFAKLKALREQDTFPILLAHHPHLWDLAEDFPLTLAGHTHGGQLMLSETSGPGPWIFKYWSGLYTRKNALVVSNGVGNWFPVRVQAPAEILHLTLRGKKA